MIRWYVWPVESVESGEMVYRGPKYLLWRWNVAGFDVPWAWVDYGLMPTALLIADVTQDQHDLAAAQPDVMAIPADIDATISAVALPTVQATLENLHIPATWINVTHTYREVMRKTAHLFQFAQRYHALTARRLIEAGYNLNTLIASLPVEVRQSLNSTALSLGWETAEIQGDWSLRQALAYLANQWGDEAIRFGDLGVL